MRVTCGSTLEIQFLVGEACCPARHKSELSAHGGYVPDRDPAGRFAPGNPGGPGRPKGSRSLTDFLRRVLAEAPKAQVIESLTAKFNLPPSVIADLELCECAEEMQARLLIWRGLHGDNEAWREIGDRVDPKVRKADVEVAPAPSIW